jgi:hypothetical protein
MNKTEILSEIPRLTPQERAEIRRKLDEYDSTDWLEAESPLTYEERVWLEARIATG